MPQVKNWLTGETILEYEGELRAAIVEAVQAGKLFTGANLFRANLSGANLFRATLSGATLSGANLFRATLSGANLSSANLSSANLSWANLSWANLSSANLSWANLSWANLSSANLSSANLSGANLSGANLSSANLSGANLSGANLSGANLYGQRIIDAGLRSDGWRFLLTGFAEEGWRIKAGCRNFTIEDARKHWSLRYVGEQRGAESLAILDHIERMAKARGWDLLAPPVDEQRPTPSQPAVINSPRTSNGGLSDEQLVAALPVLVGFNKGVQRWATDSST
jgi:hypothetical protein